MAGRPVADRQAPDAKRFASAPCISCSGDRLAGAWPAQADAAHAAGTPLRHGSSRPPGHGSSVSERPGQPPDLSTAGTRPAWGICAQAGPAARRLCHRETLLPAAAGHAQPAGCRPPAPARPPAGHSARASTARHHNDGSPRAAARRPLTHTAALRLRSELRGLGRRRTQSSALSVAASARARQPRL